MRKLLILFFSLIVIASNILKCESANYSYDAIIVYNSGVALQKQGKYELAEKKYYQALKLQPNFIEAKHNLSIIYHNYAITFYSNENYALAIENAKKSVDYDPKGTHAYSLLAQCYRDTKDYKNAIKAYNTILSSNPNDDAAMQALAQVYMKISEYDKARELYEKILKLYPDDNIAKGNLKYISHCNKEQVINQSLNNISSVPHAPKSLYRLIKPSPGITKNTVEEMKNILDLVWSEPTGQRLLQTMLKKRIPIKITQGAVTANAMRQTQTRTIMLYGFIPIFSYELSSNTVNIAYDYIHNFYNPGLASWQRIYSLQVFIHEFGHAYLSVQYPGHPNSIEEELGVSMIGYNSAYKIITGQYLTKEQTEFYSMGVLEALLKDDHRNLPVTGGFTWQIQNSGIVMPYPEVYSNIPQMYKTLLHEGKTAPVPNFAMYGR